MSATDVAVTGLGWLEAILGLALFLLPGVAAAWRWLGGLPGRYLLAPVLSMTLLVLGAIALDYVASVPVALWVTRALAVVLSVALGWPWLRKPTWTTPRVAWRELPWGLAASLLFLFVVYSLPHLPGDAPDGVFGVGLQLGDRGFDLVRGGDAPYPVHVDEHYHYARLAAIDRTGDVDVADPYTGQPDTQPLFSVSGLRSERGWQVGLVQLHHLTGIPFPVFFRFLPALWGAYTGLLLWNLLRPAPGAALAPAILAWTPTTLRFLGPGFLVPSAFALPWIVCVVLVAAKARGPGRLAVLSLLVTGGFFIHLVPGTLALAAGLLTAVLQPGTTRHRLGLVAALLLPMLWILPAMRADITLALTSEHTLPFEQGLFRRLGVAALAAVAGGVALAWMKPDPERLPHRVFGLLGAGIVVSLLWSIASEHRNDATYSRIIPTLFLCLAALASAAVGFVVAWTAPRVPKPWRSAAVAVGCALLVSFVVWPSLGASLDEPYYRVMSPQAWQAAEALAGVSVNETDLFLSHPWQAPVFNAVSGIHPYAYLVPGSAPVNGADYDFYVASGGADSAWLTERGITLIVATVPPNAVHETLAPNVFRVLSP